MPSRRQLLATIGTTGLVGAAGCLGEFRDAIGSAPTVDGPCPTRDWTWPTAGGDPGRTGRTDTAPPPTDADVENLLAGVTTDGRQRLAAGLPAVGDGVAYVPSTPGVLAVDLESPGEDPRWTYDLDDNVGATPTLACGAVLVPGLNTLVVLDPDTGERYWRVKEGGHHSTAVTAADETAFLAGVNPHAVDVRTGEVEWSVEGGDTLAVDDGVYTTLNGNGTGGIYAHDRDGEPRWHLALGKIVGSASALDGTVWVADNGGTVYAIDADTGETYWSRQLDGVEKIHSGLAVRGDDLVVPAGVGSLSHVVDAATGEPRWSANTGIVTGRPVVGDDWVAFGRTNHGVTVYDRATGEERATWTRDEYGLGTISGLVPVENGFVVHGGTTSGLALIR